MSTNGTSNGQAQQTAAQVLPRRPLGADHGPRPDLDKKKLLLWLERQSDPAQLRYQCVLFQLFLVTPKGDDALALGGPVDKKLRGEERTAQLQLIVEDFADNARATADANPEPGVCHFAVASYLTTEIKDHCHNKTHFLMAPSAEVSALGPMAHGKAPPDIAAVVGHLQRLWDTTLRMHVESSDRDKDRLAEQLAVELQHRRLLEEMNFKKAVLVEELLDKKAERDLNVARTRQQIELEGQCYRALMNYGLPILGAYVSKRTGIELQQTEHPMLTFARGLSAEQVLSFIDGLTPQQQEEFAPMMAELVSGMSDSKRRELADLANRKASERQGGGAT